MKPDNYECFLPNNRNILALNLNEKDNRASIKQ